MARYRKRPVEIEAARFAGTAPSAEQVMRELRSGPEVQMAGAGERLLLRIETLEGVMLASPGDWIVRGIAGEFYPVKPEIFEQSYEPV